MVLSPGQSVFISPTAFKESISARGLTELIQSWLFNQGFRNLTSFPGSDGGNGFLDSLSAGLDGRFIQINIPMIGAKTHIQEQVFLFDEGKKAAIETASAIGLERIPPGKRNPLTCHSGPLGFAIKTLKASVPNLSEIWIGVGGTATVDLGAGLLHELGFMFLDRDGNRVNPVPSDFNRISKLVPPAEQFPRLVFHFDVHVPSKPGQGSFIRTYGPQKGLLPEGVSLIERETDRLADQFNLDLSLTGAGGGLGLFPSRFLSSEFIHGTARISGLKAFSDRFARADLYITGEGRLDSQSLQGKWVSAFLKTEKPVLCICGSAETGLDLPQNWTVVPLDQVEPDREKSIRQVKPLIRRILGNLVSGT